MTARPRPAPIRGRLLLALAAALVALPASASPVAERAAAGRSPLTLQASSWVFAARPLEITLEQRGVLAGRRLAVDLFVDQNQFVRLTTKSDRTQAAVELPALAPGRHLLMAKVGREFAQTEFRVIPWSWPAGAAGGLLLAGVGVGYLARRRRRRSAPP